MDLVTLSPVVETRIFAFTAWHRVVQRCPHGNISVVHTKFSFHPIPPHVVRLGCPMLLTSLRHVPTHSWVFVQWHRNGTSLALVAYNADRSRITCHREITRSDFAVRACARSKLHNVRIPYILPYIVIYKRGTGEVCARKVANFLMSLSLLS